MINDCKYMAPGTYTCGRRVRAKAPVEIVMPVMKCKFIASYPKNHLRLCIFWLMGQRTATKTPRKRQEINSLLSTWKRRQMVNGQWSWRCIRLRTRTGTMKSSTPNDTYVATYGHWCRTICPLTSRLLGAEPFKFSLSQVGVCVSMARMSVRRCA